MDLRAAPLRLHAEGSLRQTPIAHHPVRPPPLSVGKASLEPPQPRLALVQEPELTKV